ncbi:MAG: CDP-diacylglycerol--glycerol-3-phosphate 3-phosphatidyltransferase [Pseudomonadota bacterium]
MRHLPNLLTGLRLVLTLVVFLALMGMASQPFVLWAASRGLEPRVLLMALYLTAFWGFVVAAVTDFLDGWLARRFKVESLAGAILDPIADKVLIAGVVVGLATLGSWTAALAGGLILFREFAVSALREVLAPRGVTLPVTLLAKWKTTLQLVAFGLQMFVGGWVVWNLPQDPQLAQDANLVADVGLWLAVAVTLWTGAEYALAARKALKS